MSNGEGNRAYAAGVPAPPKQDDDAPAHRVGTRRQPAQCAQPEIIRCPYCLGPVATEEQNGQYGLHCEPCGQRFTITADGYPIMIDLRDNGNEAPDKPLDARLAAYMRWRPLIASTCRQFAEGEPDPSRAGKPIETGPLYTHLVFWPIRRAIAMYGRDRLRNAKLLHIGPYYGREIAAFTELGARCSALDVGAMPLRCARATADAMGCRYENYVGGTVELLPFEDNAFDVVLIHKTLQWWFDQTQGLRETMRVGRVVLIVAEPAGGPLRRLFQILGFANRVSPCTQRPINEVTEAWLEEVLYGLANLRIYRYFSKAIDFTMPRRWVVALDRRPMLGRCAVWVFKTASLLLRAAGNQIIVVAEKCV